MTSRVRGGVQEHLAIARGILLTLESLQTKSSSSRLDELFRTSHDQRSFWNGQRQLRNLLIKC